jgi:Uma2 family endonuclease
MATATALMTAEEFRLLPDDGRRLELVQGVPLEMSLPTPRHGEICVNVVYPLRRYLDDNPQGRIVCNDSGIVTERNPDTVRGADVAFYSYKRIPKGPLPAGYLKVLPEVLVEVRSASDRWTEVLNKVTEYLNASVIVVCVLDDVTRTVHVFHTDQAPRIVPADGELELHELLPGFRVAVRRFFE